MRRLRQSRWCGGPGRTWGPNAGNIVDANPCRPQRSVHRSANREADTWTFLPSLARSNVEGLHHRPQPNMHLGSAKSMTESHRGRTQITVKRITIESVATERRTLSNNLQRLVSPSHAEFHGSVDGKRKVGLRVQVPFPGIPVPY